MGSKANSPRRRRRIGIADPERLPEGASRRVLTSEAPRSAGATTKELEMDLAVMSEPMPFDWPAPVMTVAEVAAVVRVTPKTVRQHIRRGLLRALQLDGAGPYRVRAEDAQRWTEQQLARPDSGALAIDRYARRPAEPAVVHVTTGRRRRSGGVSA